MKTLKVKSILFSLLAIMAVAVFMTSCEQGDIPNVQTIEHPNNTELINDMDGIEDRGKFTIRLEFGRASRDCRGFGLCLFEIEIEIDLRGEDGYNFAELSKLDNGHLVMDFDTQCLSDYEKEYYFSGGETFVMGEDFVLPNGLSVQLGLPAGYTIEAGQYQVFEQSSENYYRVIF